MDAETYIVRWSPGEGGAERSNQAMSMCEFCDVILVARPDPAGASREFNDYVFERAVRRRDSDGVTSYRRIDLYKRGCFILEAKQSRMPGASNALPPRQSGAGDAGRVKQGMPSSWDVMMRNARRQAEQYVFLLEPDHPAPPFILVYDVGNVFEIYADFSGTGRGYTHFPDRNQYRISIHELRRPEIREFFQRIWTDPYSLDPARRKALVTRKVAGRLAVVSKALEQDHHPEEVALFLMRCIFCMFASSVALLPKGRFVALLEECQKSPAALVPLLTELWTKMDTADRADRFFAYFCGNVRHFNGNLYRNPRVLSLSSEAIGELIAAAEFDWIDVDPAIFGTLLEQALEPDERRKLGAHYTPRAYVERLVEGTIMEVLRTEWATAVKLAEDATERGDGREAINIVQAFHRRLCALRILDPACGTGNFIYVSMELMKRLEGEVLEMLAQLGVSDALGLDLLTVGPHQFLGLEVNLRAAAIAELVIWIGYLQQHYRTRTGHPSEPILRAFTNINYGARSGYDALISWDDAPEIAVVAKDGKRFETCPNSRPSAWPKADFIVGNPPYMGGKDLRSRLGDAYAEALWKAYPHMNESADLVMYWWDRAAEALTRKGTSLKRFGFVTTNSICQVFQRRTVERHLGGKKPVSIVMAIPDHPWTKASKESAAVRIAMTVVEAGRKPGTRYTVIDERDLSSDAPRIEYAVKAGPINSDLSIGVNLNEAKELRASVGICSRGVQLMGDGFIVTREEARSLGVGNDSSISGHIRAYRNGSDLTGHSRNKLVIDLYGLTAGQVRHDFPMLYQHLTERVRYSLGPDGQPRTDRRGRRLGREWNNRPTYRSKWWLFGEPRRELREALEGLPRYIATVETAKHRVFQFLNAEILPDNKIVCIALDDGADLAILHSNIHERWFLANSGMLGVYDREAVYVKSRCFDPFPFPDPSSEIRRQLRNAGEELDALRKRALHDNPDLTLTGLYNVLEKIKSDVALTAREEDVKRRGLVVILRELHETIDALTAEAYEWPHDLGDEEIVSRLVALNLERAKEEAQGSVMWLRPSYQVQRFSKQGSKNMELEVTPAATTVDDRKPPFPKQRDLQLLAVEAVINSTSTGTDAVSIARSFQNGGRKIEARVAQMLMNLSIYGHIRATPDGRFVGK